MKHQAREGKSLSLKEKWRCLMWMLFGPEMGGSSRGMQLDLFKEN